MNKFGTELKVDAWRVELEIKSKDNGKKYADILLVTLCISIGTYKNVLLVPTKIKWS